MSSSALHIDSTVELLSGYRIPRLGYGVYQTPADECESVVQHAMKTGYRHVDSAHIYHNEVPSVAGVLAAALPREQVFYTTKVPPQAINYRDATKCIQESLARTGPPEQKTGALQYIDLVLLHCPYGGKEARLGAWRACVEAVRAGKVRSIGVSNYGVHHLQELEDWIKETEAKEGKGAGGIVSVNQIELHPFLPHRDIVQWCQSRGIVVEAWGPLVRAQKMHDERVVGIAKKHARTVAQVLIRWSLQKVCGRSAGKARMNAGWANADAPLRDSCLCPSRSRRRASRRTPRCSTLSWTRRTCRRWRRTSTTARRGTRR